MTAVAVGLLLLAAWPLWRLAGLRPFRAKLRAFPRRAAAFALLLVAWPAAVLALALTAPPALHALAAGAVAGWLVVLWRSRPDWGRRRGLPPGSLIPAPLGPWTDLDYYRRSFARHGPVFKHSNVLQPGVCIGDLALGDRLLRAAADRLGPSRAIPFDRLVPGGLLRYMSRARHAAYRPQLLRALPAGVIHASEEDLAAIVRVGLARAASRDEVPAAPALLELARALMRRIFFGVAPEDPEAGPLAAAYAGLDARRPPWLSATRRRSLARLESVLAQVARRPDLASRASYLGRLAAGRRGIDRTLLLHLALLAEITGQDMAGLFGWCAKMLSDHPRCIAALRADRAADDRAAPQPAERVVLETLRLEQSEFVVRRVLQDVTFEGWRLPRGWHVRICKREGHRAAPGVSDAERFDPDRFRDGPLPPASYAAFGPPETACPGETMTRRIGAVFVRELVHGYDWQLVGDGRPAFDGFHWTPGRNLGLRLRPRAAPGDEAP